MQTARTAEQQKSLDDAVTLALTLGYTHVDGEWIRPQTAPEPVADAVQTAPYIQTPRQAAYFAAIDVHAVLTVQIGIMERAGAKDWELADLRRAHADSTRVKAFLQSL
jgi:hypothetical protein